MGVSGVPQGSWVGQVGHIAKPEKTPQIERNTFINTISHTLLVISK